MDKKGNKYAILPPFAPMQMMREYYGASPNDLVAFIKQALSESQKQELIKILRSLHVGHKYKFKTWSTAGLWKLINGEMKLTTDMATYLGVGVSILVFEAMTKKEEETKNGTIV